MLNKGKQFLSELKLHSDYLKWQNDKDRYETWNEACESIVDGHRKKYKGINIEEYLKVAEGAIKNKSVLASQRNLQYRYEQIINSNTRLYNCVGVLFNKNDYFQKCFYVLLSGCGLDFSLRKRFINELSTIGTRLNGTKTFVIPDSIEGWADALGVLMSSYLTDNQPFPEYAGYQIKFDYSLIRPKGAYISGGFKAPGSEGLKQSLDKIEQLLNNWLSNRGAKITSILVYDIIMHAADAVLSGGVRRCLAKGSKVLVKEGTYKLIENIQVGDYVKTLNGYKKVTNTFIQGEQKTIKIIHQSGELICTPNHKIAVIEGKEVIWKEAGKLVINDKLIFSLKEEETTYVDKLPRFDYIRPPHSTTCKNIIIPELDEEIAYLIGLIQGDGYVRLTPKSGELSIAIEGDKPEKVYFVVNILRRFGVNPGIQEPTNRDNSYKVRVKSKQLATYLHEYVKQAKTTLRIPIFILKSSPKIKKAFISGVFCADGSFKTRPPQVATSVYKPFLEELQALLGELGIHSNIKCRVYPSRSENWQDIYSLTVRGKDNFNNFKKLLVLTPKSNDKDYIINQGNTTILKPIKNIQPILIEEITEGSVVETFDIEVEDEHSFMCEGVLVHNSACSVLIDEDDQEMIEAKLGNWRQSNPQRARSNNAIGFIRNKFSYEKLHGIINLNQGDNDISFILVHDEYEASNPCREITFRPILEDGRTGFQMCVAPNTKLITKEGIEQIGQVAEEKREIEIWNGEKWSKVKPIKTGVDNKLYRVYFNDGSYLDANYNHKFLIKNRFQENFEEKTTGELINLLNTTKYALQVPRFKMEYEGGINEPKAYDYGFILGDGTCKSYEDGKLRKPFASVFESNFHLDFPFVSGNKGKILLRDNRGKQSKYYNVSFDVDYNFSERLKYGEGLPKEIFTWNKESIKNFLAGWIDSDGTITYNNKVRVYGEESKIRDLQLLLTKIGTNSSVNLASKKGDITNYATRKRDVWYVQISNCDGLWCTKTKLYKTEVSAKGKYQNIKNIEELENTSDVYCFEEFELHQGVFNNILTKQCNLTEINASACDTMEKFFSACEAASILGTLQAGYTNFTYLGKDTEELVKREALIGVSITGWMNNPMLFSPQLLKSGAAIVKDTNKKLAKIIGTNQAARTTTVKPSGNASVILGTASGIHPEHSEKYFRVMQLNKESNTAKYLEENMPFLLEESVWSASNSDYVVYVPIENPKSGLYKKDMKGIKHLEFVKLVQENWVNAGTNPELCLRPWLRNSVSCTIIIDNLDEITKYIYTNQDSFKAVSFISDYGDKDFNQAPFTSVSSLEEIISKYGKGALFASGLIVDGLHYFNDNLWIACDLVKDRSIKVIGTREQVILKKYWLSRVKKFAKNFFGGDMQTTVHCLKDVHLLHKWEVINRDFQLVDFSKILSKPEYKDVGEYSATACSGGACEIMKF